MSRREHGGLRRSVAQPDSNGFVNRRSTVQSCPPAQASNNPEFTQVTALEAIEGYLDGTVSAKRATEALAWQVRNPPAATHTEVFAARARQLGLSDIAAARLVNGLRATARKVAAGKLDPYDGILESRTLALTALRQERAS